MTTEEAAKALGVSARRVRAMITAGKLPSKEVGIPPRITHMIDPADLVPLRDRRPGKPRKTKES